MKKVIYSVFLILLTFIFSGYVLKQADAPQNGTQAIKFPHKVHVVDNEMECIDCHGSIEESTKAEDVNFPEKDVCAGCHDVEDEDNCGLCHVNPDEPEGFTVKKRSFNFSHKAHLGGEETGCDKCHAGIEQTMVNDGSKIPGQAACNKCHDGIAATKNCLTCHAPTMQFKPADHNLAWSRGHMVQIRAGNDDCAHCHTNNYCQECHESVDLVSTKILPNDYYGKYVPQADGETGLVIQAVHDLNYRFIHQLDALGKDHDCSTCHEASFYCAECHASENNQAGIRPTWHGGPDWGALALSVGSGGGRHAELARRDIERCADCHDVQGADPTCLMCHTDFDGVRNTDPKTHDSGFMNRFGEGSDFHNDDASICFTCHVNTKQAGIGFCGYCHSGE